MNAGPRFKKLSDLAVEMQEVAERLINELNSLGCGPDMKEPEDEFHFKDEELEKDPTPSREDMKSPEYDRDKERRKAALIIRFRKRLK